MVALSCQTLMLDFIPLLARANIVERKSLGKLYVQRVSLQMRPGSECQCVCVCVLQVNYRVVYPRARNVNVVY